MFEKALISNAVKSFSPDRNGYPAVSTGSERMRWDEE
jgi:hypothetical protein